jgi:hypothetical protein
MLADRNRRRGGETRSLKSGEKKQCGERPNCERRSFHGMRRGLKYESLKEES